MKLAYVFLCLLQVLSAEVIDLSEFQNSVSAAFKDHDYAVVSFYDRSLTSQAVTDILNQVEPTFASDRRKIGFGIADVDNYSMEKIAECEYPCIVIFAFVRGSDAKS